MRGGDAGHGPWHLRFDGGRQQRYLADRREVLRYVLDIGRQSANPRFEVWAEAEPPRTASGGVAAGGRSFTLFEVLDLSLPEVREQVRAELDRLAQAGGAEPSGGTGSSEGPGGAGGPGATMPGDNGSGPREPGGQAGRSPIKIIPLTPGPAVTPGERREAMRAAVVQVIDHLVVENVPAERRSPHFEQARGLLDEAGWGLDELIAAADPGPAREELFAVIGLS